VDTTKTITHVSLCAGYGGIDIGLARAIPNLRTIAFSEIEAFACANLVSKMEAGLLDAAPIWTNLKTFPWEEFRGVVDILSGGYPCQPFSAAGKRLGEEDPRHLWPFIANGIAIMRPSICFFENVEGHISLGLPDVIEDLAGMGYRTTWGIFSASEVGAPHQRKRVFIMAHNSSQRIQGCWAGGVKESQPYAREALSLCGGNAGGVWPSRPGQPQYEWEPPRVVGDSRSAKLHGVSDRQAGESMAPFGEPSDQRQIKSALGRNFDESSCGLGHAELYVSCDNRTDKLRLLGNGVVPATATLAFITLSKDLGIFQ